MEDSSQGALWHTVRGVDGGIPGPPHIALRGGGPLIAVGPPSERPRRLARRPSADRECDPGLRGLRTHPESDLNARNTRAQAVAVQHSRCSHAQDNAVARPGSRVGGTTCGAMSGKWFDTVRVEMSIARAEDWLSMPIAAATSTRHCRGGRSSQWNIFSSCTIFRISSSMISRGTECSL